MAQVHAKIGSIVKCVDSATGCGRMWRLDSTEKDFRGEPILKWVEVFMWKGEWITTKAEQEVPKHTYKRRRG